uniref:Kinesin motor domain-containing protein n=1 Tax=Steinernema glaseri TaxID=37863 RepID=A0A1I7Y4E8_9BILA
TEIEVIAVPPRIRSISHPTANARCVVVQKECSVDDDNVERISITSIDPEAVDDWNLELLFGSLRL